MKRYVNLRPTLAAALLFIAGILAGYVYLRGMWYIFLSLFVALAIALVLLSVKKRRLNTLCLVLLLACCAGFFTFQLRCGIVDSFKTETNSVTVSGYITDDSYIKGNYYVIRNVTMSTNETQTILAGNVSMYLYPNQFSEDEVQPQIGYKLTVTADVCPSGIFKDGINTYDYKKQVYNRLYNVSNPVCVPAEMRITEKVRTYIKTTLYRYMEEDNAAIAYALIVGDKSEMNPVDKVAFRKSGIAHVLAVSGLHVGFLCTIFNFLLQRFGVRKRNRFFVMILPLLAYCILVGFSSSVVRATIMTLIILFASRKGVSGDMLTSLSTAVIVLLCISPFYLFDVGFLLSVFAVLGIALISLTLNRLLYDKRGRFWVKYLVRPFSLTLGATLTTLPLIAHFYGEIATLSLLSNLILVPVISLAYMLIVVGLIPLPLIGYVLWLPDKIISLVRTVTVFISRLPFSTLVVCSFGVGAVFFILLLFFCSDYVSFNKVERLIATVTSFALFITFALIAGMPLKNQDAIYYYDGYEDCIIASNVEGETVIICNFATGGSIDNVYEYMQRRTPKTLYLCIPQYAKAEVDHIDFLINTYKIDFVIKLNTQLNGEVDALLCSEKYRIPIYTDYNPLGDSLFKHIVTDDFDGCRVNLGNFSFLYAFSTVVPNTPLVGIDLAVFKDNSADFATLYNDITVFGKGEVSRDNYFNLSTYGNFTIKLKNDKITVEL